MRYLVTGVAGFIGMHLARRLLDRGDAVIGIDNLNDYYQVSLKHDRLNELKQTGSKSFVFHQVDFGDHVGLEAALANETFDAIAHLGAQAGVRYSLQNPRAYAHSNLLGHLNMLEIARHRSIASMVYASSSSVYGGNDKLPFCVEDRADNPVSLYAATKRADEMMSESYAHLYRLPLTGLRFFTVYGPWGRPDMAMWIFTKAILEGRPIAVFNDGQMRRDFTFIDDIIKGTLSALDTPPRDDGKAKAGGSRTTHALYNIGNNEPEELGYLIDLIETACGKPAVRDYQPMQPGDVIATFADISAIKSDLGFQPVTKLADGVQRFVDWYRSYHTV